MMMTLNAHLEVLWYIPSVQPVKSAFNRTYVASQGVLCEGDSRVDVDLDGIAVTESRKAGAFINNGWSLGAIFQSCWKVYCLFAF